MNLYVLERLDIGYDEAIGFVIRAEDGDDARRIARRRDDGDRAWLDPAKTTCKQFISPGRAAVILKSVRHG